MTGMMVNESKVFLILLQCRCKKPYTFISYQNGSAFVTDVRIYTSVEYSESGCMSAAVVWLPKEYLIINGAYVTIGLVMIMLCITSVKVYWTMCYVVKM